MLLTVPSERVEARSAVAGSTMSCQHLPYGTHSSLGRWAVGRRGGAVISLVSGLLQNTLGQFWLSLISGEGKKIIFVSIFFLKKS